MSKLYHIVAVTPNSHYAVSHVLELNKDTTDTFTVEDDGVIRSTGDSCWHVTDDQKLEYSATTSTHFEIIRDPETGSVRLKYQSWYVSHENYRISLSMNKNPSSSWILVPSLPVEDHHVVIARYREDISWVRFLPFKVWVYNKSRSPLLPLWKRDNVTIMDLRNEGREGHTYLTHIIDHYDRLPSRITFLQADPFSHSPCILQLLAGSIDQPFQDYQSLSMWYVKGRIPPTKVTRQAQLDTGGNLPCVMYKIDNSLHMVDFRSDSGIECCIRNYKRENGMSMHLDIVPHFLRRIGLSRLAKKEYLFSISALFSCTSTQIQSLSKNDWMRIRTVLTSRMVDGGREGYILERMWHTLLTG